MSKSLRTAALILLLALLFSLTAHANMAAPASPDIGSAITFERNDAVSVLSEVLDLTVTGPQAQIVATYRMKNTTAEPVSVEPMFLSPQMESAGVRVTANGKDLPFTSKSYALNYSTTIATQDWAYVVLTDGQIAAPEDQTVDTVSFRLDFGPEEAYDVTVSYLYRLGGYPDYDFNAKRGEILYYLAPAAMWRDFSDLTIRLTLDSDMPVIKSSSLPFEKTGARTYQYHSDTLPDKNLEIVIDENWWQNILSTLRSPYLPFTLLLLSPLLIIAAAVVAVILWRLHKRRQNRDSRGEPKSDVR